MYLFSRKIICRKCGKRFKGYRQHGKLTYICSTFSNKGKEFCDRQMVEQDELIYLVEKHMFIKGIKKEEISIQEYVKRIEREGENLEILYTDGSRTVINDNRILF